MFRQRRKAIISGVVFALGALGIWSLSSHGKESGLPGPLSYLSESLAPNQTSTIPSIFASQYPASQKMQLELQYAKNMGKLLRENEELINRVITSMSQQFNMPPSVLWCLLFQESRLDHLRGISNRSGSRGLGQFSSFGFYEVNHHLDKFYAGSSKAWIELLGRDVRPVVAKSDNLLDPSSYFYIPTAVISSATYLNNRYHHLSHLLNRQGVIYDPQVLWLHAALAYNKGTRTVLALWKETKRYRPRTASKLFVDRRVFMASIGSSDLMTRALMRIWPQTRASSYSREASRHMESIQACAIPSGGVP